MLWKEAERGITLEMMKDGRKAEHQKVASKDAESGSSLARMKADW